MPNKGREKWCAKLDMGLAQGDVKGDRDLELEECSFSLVKRKYFLKGWRIALICMVVLNTPPSPIFIARKPFSPTPRTFFSIRNTPCAVYRQCEKGAAGKYEMQMGLTWSFTRSSEMADICMRRSCLTPPSPIFIARKPFSPNTPVPFSIRNTPCAVYRHSARKGAAAKYEMQMGLTWSFFTRQIFLCSARVRVLVECLLWYCNFSRSVRITLYPLLEMGAWCVLNIIRSFLTNVCVTIVNVAIIAVIVATLELFITQQVLALG
ncbi:hypothetical protein CEXT_403871 [Caerostris extrusa]|uniref:Uncharacterized protein n=1 Tax=Caerostris extrusa TaxID=172846 RepID=A0AAV4RPV3_CAEEX|nr:hypothetical protein CEXT_403871 [Caerostris extrusa]